MNKNEVNILTIHNYEELLSYLKEVLEKRKTENVKDRYVVAIDGRCGSGKTTGVKMIAKELGCEIIQMDDFYLTPEMRTAERREEPGGNVDYIRFAKEVLPNIKKRESFSYGKYQVETDSIIAHIEIKNPDIVIIEGAYSMRPEFRECYDLKVFSNASRELQIKRLTEREGEYVKEYIDLWMPLENKYIKYFNLEEICDIIIDVG